MHLRDLLQTHTWRMLRAIARAHRASFDNDWTKAEASDEIFALLRDPQVVRRALAALPTQAHEALQTLLSCGGQMPAHRFLDQFGPVRPYRPWRDDSPHAPWRNPVSPAERLWFLGLIFFASHAEGTVVTIPDDLLALLPTPPPPTALERVAPLSSPPDPILDVAHLLAYLQGHDLTPFAGRWLTPRPLRALNAGLAYPDPTVREARSELQSGYLRFLHYLAEAAGLVDLVGGLLKPMPAAWTWLDMSEPQRWHALWEGWQRDLEPKAGQQSLWNRYRFPARPAFVITLFETLQYLETNRSLQEAAFVLPSLVTHVRRRCIGAATLPPDDDVLTPLQALVSGPLTWGGIVNMDAECNVTFTPQGAWLLGSAPGPPDPPPTAPAAIRYAEDHLIMLLPEPPGRPPLRPLVSLGLPAKSRRTRHLTRERFVSFLGHGLGRAGIVGILGALTAGAVPSAVIKRLETWEAEARGLQLRRLTVLSVADPQTLEKLTGQRSIRPLLRETLSPHHIAVDPDQIERLLRTLRRRGDTPLVEPGAHRSTSMERRATWSPTSGYVRRSACFGSTASRRRW